MFQAVEPVTNCDQFGLFFRRKPKGEIHRETVRVSFDGLIQGLRRDAVYFSQVCVDHYAMAPDGEDPLGDVSLPKGRQPCVGLRFQILDHAVARFNYCARLSPVLEWDAVICGLLHAVDERHTMYDMKTSAVTIRIEPDLQKLLDKVCKQSGRTRSDIVRDSLKRQLSIIRFEQLRRQVLPFAEARGYLTDEDVNKAVS